MKALDKLGAGETAHKILLVLILVSCIHLAHAATMRVGPGEQITRIADAARLAKDGDTVEILPGEYRGDVAVWQQQQLVIRGIGKRPVLIADGKSAEGKAIWVIRNGDFRIENIEFRGSRVPAGNGAGIRFERGKLAISNCVFIDNQNGILSGNDPDSKLAIDNSRFADAPRQMHSLPHLLHIGRIDKVTITGSRFKNGYRGHLVKSRARQSFIRDNHIVDGPEGEASYEIDLPNGGIARITGNTIGQSAKTQNPVLISYGAEGKVWPENSLTLKGNTLISDILPAGWFLRVHQDKFPTTPTIHVENNRTVGLGISTPDILQTIQH
ncbi:MAG: right-handed parallel beta-helix repeat-containing protein [Pseudomonadota bacterium]